jgi:hypothetical protein
VLRYQFVRGFSSVGRAPFLHGGCQRFESANLHLGFICISFNSKVKKIMVYGGYLGMERRRRAWFSTKNFGELRTSYNPKIPESTKVEILLL